MSVKPRCYISLMDVAQNLIWISSYYIYLKLLMIILFSFQWCLLKAAFFWKTMFVVIYTKIFVVRKGVSAPLFFFHAPFSISRSRFFRNMQPPSPSWHPSLENTRFYDDTLESGRLKTIWSYGNLMSIETVCLNYWMCSNRYHSDN